MTKNALTFIFIFFSIALNSQSKTWTGVVDDLWFNPGNWNPFGVPTEDNDVLVNINTVINVDTTGGNDTAYAKTLYIENVSKFALLPGAIMVINSSGSLNQASVEIHNSLFSSHAELYISGALSDAMRVDDGSLVQIQEDGELYILDFANNANGQAIDIEASCTFSNRGNVAIRGGGTKFEDGIVNDGSFMNEPTAILYIDNIMGNSQSFGIESYAQFDNKGMIHIDSIESAAGIQISGASATLKNDGSITTTNILNSAKSGVDILNGATLYGEGVFTTHLLAIGGNTSILNPGGLTGTDQMILNGDLYLDDASLIEIDIRGDNGPDSSAGHDQIVVHGEIELDGDVTNKPNLKINLLSGFIPEMHKNYAFISLTGIVTGSFDNNVNKPMTLTGWSWYTMDKHIVFRRYCGGDNIAEVCGGDCFLRSGMYHANNLIQYSGDFTIPEGEEIEFSSPETELLNGFSVELGAEFEVLTDQCSS